MYATLKHSYFYLQSRFIQPAVWLVLLTVALVFPLPCIGADDKPAYEYAQIRLYNFRHAAGLATQLGNLFPALTLSSAAAAPDGTDDVLVAVAKVASPPPTSEEVHRSIGELKRVLALLDLPRPQVTLQVWSLKVSSKDPDEIDATARRLRREIDIRNQRIQKALQFGWFKLMARAQGKGETQWRSGDEFLDKDFREYISKAFVIDEQRKVDKYSLGYVHAFSPSKPSLATMLMCLAAVKKPKEWVDGVIQDMEQNHPEDNKPSVDVADPIVPPPTFNNFKAYLLALVDPEGSPENSNAASDLGGGQQALRAAIADFLFQYKWATLYPHDFVGYDLQNSATVLDSLFAPAVDALNRDIADYMKGITKEEEEKTKKRGAKFELASRGLITISALSGTQATVQGKTVSYFDVTKPPTLSEMVGGMQKPLTDLKAVVPGLSGLASNPAALIGALGALSSQEKTFVEIEKGMNLTITPITLATASSAELDIDLDAAGNDKPGDDEGTPNTVTAKDSKDTVDRIARHAVKTRVRVDSLKLFEVSSFSFNLLHERPDGVVPVVGQVWDGVFGAVPGAGRLFKWHRSPDISAHRSLVIVSALIVPTSMDLALGIRVESDRKLDKVKEELQAHSLHTIEGDSNDTDPLLHKARPFHKKKLECLLAPKEWVTFQKSDCTCEKLTLDCVAADYGKSPATGSN